MRWCEKIKTALCRFGKDTSGVTAVEFALVIIPFLTIVLGTIELGRAFSIQGSLTRVSDEAVRQTLICRINITKLDRDQIEAKIQDFVTENAGLGGPATAVVSFASGGDYVLDMNMPFRFIVPLFPDNSITLNVTRPLVDTCG